MPKHVTFNPNVQYQHCDITTTTICATDKKIVPLSDKPSYLRNRKSKSNKNAKPKTNINSGYNTAINIIKMATSNLLLSNKNITLPNNNTITRQLAPAEPMDIDHVNAVEPMDIDL